MRFFQALTTIVFSIVIFKYGEVLILDADVISQKQIEGCYGKIITSYEGVAYIVISLSLFLQSLIYLLARPSSWMVSSLHLLFLINTWAWFFSLAYIVANAPVKGVLAYLTSSGILLMSYFYYSRMRQDLAEPVSG